MSAEMAVALEHFQAVANGNLPVVLGMLNGNELNPRCGSFLLPLLHPYQLDVHE